MDEIREKRQVRFVRNSSFWATWFLFLVFLGVGIAMLYHGKMVSNEYNARKNIENLSLGNLQPGSYVEGMVNYTLCCYGQYDLDDYYVIAIGKEDKEFVTVLSRMANSVALEKLPTLGYEWQDGGTEFEKAQKGYYICGIVEELKQENFNYAYLERQFNTSSHDEIHKMISPKYCIKLIDPDNISFYENLGKLFLFISAIVFVSVVLPSYRRKVRIERVEEDTANQYRMNRQRTSKSIKNFIENAYDRVVQIIFEHKGDVIQITSKSQIHDVLDCFLSANYDRVYEDIVEQDELYQIEIVLENEESICSSLNDENVISWYGNYNRMDRISGKRLRTIFQSMEI